MSFKSRIPLVVTGLAAAIPASVSPVYAADAVVIEPEPIEYVRVCEAYGTGYFYIPGTETCIRFGGFLRSSYEKVTLDGSLASGANLVSGGSTNGGDLVLFSDAEVHLTGWVNRARLNIDTRNETEWGTLSGLFRLEGGDSNVDANIDMDVALISLAGFRAGFAGANYWNSNTDWVNFKGVGGAGFTDEGFLGFDDATIFDYTFAADGFAITAGVEDPRIDVSSITLGGGGGGNATNNGGSESNANFYAGFNYSGNFGAVYFTAVHDSLATETIGPLAAGVAPEGGWAYRGNVTLDLGDFIPGGKLVGQYSYDGSFRTAYVHTDGITYDPEAILGVGFEADLTEELQFVSHYTHVTADDDEGEGDTYLASVGLNWSPKAAPGFSLRASYYFGEVENSLGFGADDVNGTVAAADRASYDFDGFFVGVRRDF